MIDGSIDWQAKGLVRPESIISATNEYFEEQDLFGHWLEECAKSNAKIGTNGKMPHLFRKWRNYAEAGGERPGQQGRCQRTGFPGICQKRVTGGRTAYTGLRLKPKRQYPKKTEIVMGSDVTFPIIASTRARKHGRTYGKTRHYPSLHHYLRDYARAV